jgi:hypothetical protein
MYGRLRKGERKMKYKGQINRGWRIDSRYDVGWVTIAESDSYTSAKNIVWDYAIEHDCDWRVVGA